MRITSIFIAAGLSSRMKGPNKLLEEIEEGKTLVQHTYTQLEASNVDEVIVVTGRDAEQVQLSIVNSLPKASEPKFVHNTSFELGMTTSIQAGLKSIDQADAVMICLSDMPLLNTDHYNLLINAFKAQRTNHSILSPFKGTMKGNPVIFGADYFTDIAAHKEMNGCSKIIQSNSESLIKVPVESEAYFFDIDTPEAFDEYKRRVN